MPTKHRTGSAAAACTAAEQAFLQTAAKHGAAPSKAHAAVAHGTMTLTGWLPGPDGTVRQADAIGDPRQAEALGRQLAEHLIHF